MRTAEGGRGTQKARSDEQFAEPGPRMERATGIEPA